MSFEKKDWKDRIAEYINRRRITHEDGTSELITVERDEGTISQEGDAFNAENMNEFEERIAKALTPLDSMSAITANTQDNQLAGAKAVKELGEDLACYYPPRKFQSDEDALVYAVSLLETKDNIFVPFSIVDSPGCGSEYSSGFITVRWDTCSVVIFNYQSSRINVNSRSKDGKWTGWEQAAFYRELANYLPLSGGTLTNDIEIGDGSAKDRRVNVRSNTRQIALVADSNANGSQSYAGIYDFVNHIWLISNDGASATLMNDGKKILTSADFVVTGSANEATLTINLD